MSIFGHSGYEAEKVGQIPMRTQMLKNRNLAVVLVSLIVSLVCHHSPVRFRAAAAQASLLVLSLLPVFHILLAAPSSGSALFDNDSCPIQQLETELVHYFQTVYQRDCASRTLFFCARLEAVCCGQRSS